MTHPYAALRERADWTLVAGADLPDGEHGRWYQRLKVMALRRGLTRVERRCAVAHETHHALAGDEPTGIAHFDAHAEAAADQAAARSLITLDALTRALMWATNSAEVAEELDVTPALLTVRLDHLHPTERAHLKRALAQREEAA